MVGHLFSIANQDGGLMTPTSITTGHDGQTAAEPAYPMVRTCPFDPPAELAQLRAEIRSPGPSVGRQLTLADHAIRGRPPVLSNPRRARRQRRRGHPVRARPRPDRGGGRRVLEGRLHRRLRRAGRRRGPGPVPRGGRRAVAGASSLGRTLNQDLECGGSGDIRPDWDLVTDGCSGAAAAGARSPETGVPCAVWKRPPDPPVAASLEGSRGPRLTRMGRVRRRPVSASVAERSSYAADPPRPRG